tara:strand:+ start:1421 stop:1564 length:144 start_codon:yes stop_codon:yes gene_type:complete
MLKMTSLLDILGKACSINSASDSAFSDEHAISKIIKLFKSIINLILA